MSRWTMMFRITFSAASAEMALLSSSGSTADCNSGDEWGVGMIGMSDAAKRSVERGRGALDGLLRSFGSISFAGAS